MTELFHYNHNFKTNTEKSISKRATSYDLWFPDFAHTFTDGQPKHWKRRVVASADYPSLVSNFIGSYLTDIWVHVAVVNACNEAITPNLSIYYVIITNTSKLSICKYTILLTCTCSSFVTQLLAMYNFCTNMSRHLQATATSETSSIRIVAPLALSSQSVALITSGWSQYDRASSKINIRSLKVGYLHIQNVSPLSITISSNRRHIERGYNVSNSGLTRWPEVFSATISQECFAEKRQWRGYANE